MRVKVRGKKVPQALAHKASTARNKHSLFYQFCHFVTRSRLRASAPLPGQSPPACTVRRSGSPAPPAPMPPSHPHRNRHLLLDCNQPVVDHTCLDVSSSFSMFPAPMPPLLACCRQPSHLRPRSAEALRTLLARA